MEDRVPPNFGDILSDNIIIARKNGVLLTSFGIMSRACHMLASSSS
jgi:hypothetical protein